MVSSKLPNTTLPGPGVFGVKVRFIGSKTAIVPLPLLSSITGAK
jgi:hypothetical protein